MNKGKLEEENKKREKYQLFIFLKPFASEIEGAVFADKVTNKLI